jgi:sporulation protein YlmC with PRC-barrel domain
MDLASGFVAEQWEEGERMMRLSDENLRGRTIISADGQVVGEVDSLFLDADAWRVESLRATLRKSIADELGSQRSVFHAAAVEIPVGMVQSVGATVVLSVPVDGLRAVLPNQPAQESAH